MNLYFLAAALMAWLTFLIHLVLGGRELVRPLLASRDLHLVVRTTHHFCWHLVSLALAFIALCLNLAALDPAFILLGRAATALAAGFGLLNLGFALVHRLSPRWLPQWLLFLAIVLPGVAGSLV